MSNSLKKLMKPAETPRRRVPQRTRVSRRVLQAKMFFPALMIFQIIFSITFHTINGNIEQMYEPVADGDNGIGC
jgi:hypothetical protein